MIIGIVSYLYEVERKQYYLDVFAFVLVFNSLELCCLLDDF